MNRVQLVLFVIFPIIGSFPLHAQEAAIIPADYYIGEAVTVRITLSAPDTDEDVKPYITQEDKWIEIRTIDTVRRENKVFIFLQIIPYFPGRRTLPVIKYGEHEIAGIEVNPRKLLDDGDYSFAAMRNEFLLPGTKLVILLFSLLVIGAIFAALIIAKRIRPFMSIILEKIRAWQGKLKRRNRYRYLLTLYDTLPSSDIYKHIGKEIRRSIEYQCSIASFHLTTSEISDLFQDTTLSQILTRGDSVRFGNMNVSVEQIAEDIRSAELFSILLEREKPIHTKDAG